MGERAHAASGAATGAAVLWRFACRVRLNARPLWRWRQCTRSAVAGGVLAPPLSTRSRCCPARRAFFCCPRKGTKGRRKQHDRRRMKGAAALQGAAVLPGWHARLRRAGCQGGVTTRALDPLFVLTLCFQSVCLAGAPSPLSSAPHHLGDAAGGARDWPPQRGRPTVGMALACVRADAVRRRRPTPPLRPASSQGWPGRWTRSASSSTCAWGFSHSFLSNKRSAPSLRGRQPYSTTVLIKMPGGGGP